ncbi:MAG: hypothetical protein AB1523_01665 [Bacillota bacterium]
MKFKPESFRWALQSLKKYGDSDLFTYPVELSVLNELGDSAVLKIADCDLGNFIPGPARRFIVPKDDLSYRVATQLDPLDSLVFTALAYEYGHFNLPISSSINHNFRHDQKNSSKKMKNAKRVWQGLFSWLTAKEFKGALNAPAVPAFKAIEFSLHTLQTTNPHSFLHA